MSIRQKPGPKPAEYPEVDIGAFKVPQEVADGIESLRKRGLYGRHQADVLRVLLIQALTELIHKGLLESRGGQERQVLGPPTESGSA